MTKTAFLISICAAFFYVSHGFQFVIGGSAPECFVVELPQDTPFVVKYKFPGGAFGSGATVKYPFSYDGQHVAYILGDQILR